MKPSKLTAGQTVRVIDECYSPPPTASRNSTELAAMTMASVLGEKERDRLLTQKEKYAKSARGVVSRNVVGVISCIKDGLVAFKNLSTGKIECAEIDACTPIILCCDCDKREATKNNTLCKKCKKLKKK